MIAIVIVAPLLILASLAIATACVVAGTLSLNMKVIKSTGKRVGRIWYI
jgi:2-methylaconitate cis-trans-isomerase PrpF